MVIESHSGQRVELVRRSTGGSARSYIFDSVWLGSAGFFQGSEKRASKLGAFECALVSLLCNGLRDVSLPGVAA